MINLRHKRIIVTFLMHLGDLVLITPFLQVLRRHAHGSDITLVVDEKVADVVRTKKARIIQSARCGVLGGSCTKIITTF